MTAKLLQASSVLIDVRARRRAGSPLASMVLGTAVLMSYACGARVSPQLPAAPHVTAPGGAKAKVALIGSGASTALMSELQALLSTLGPVEQRTLEHGEAVTDLCTEGYGLVACVTPGRKGFASNAAERNTLFIYETAVVVGLPVTLISAVTWPWHGEWTAEGDLETLWCGSGKPVHTRALASIRADGYGFIAQDRLQHELEPHMATGLARALVDAAERCGRLEKGGDRCSEEGHY